MTSTVGQARRMEPSRRARVRVISTTHDACGLGLSNASRVVLQERAGIARELHDSVSQTLYAITLTATRARKLVEQNQVRHMVDELVRLSEVAQGELRAIITNIHSNPLTGGGLIAALTNLASDVRTCNGLDVRLSLVDEPDISPEAREAVALIAREALHNVAKHANADRVHIVLEMDRRRMVLLISDNGRGFDSARVRPGHFGLQTMRERANAVGGTLELLSSDGFGTHVCICIPARFNA